MKDMWFELFSEASKWAKRQRCGVIQRSSDGNGFTWFLPLGEEAPYGAIDVDRVSTFVSYGFGGMSIDFKDLFSQELSKYQKVSDDQNKVIVESDKILAWHDLETGLYWDAALVFQDFHGTMPIGVHKALNEFKYAGFSDWREPTIFELSTLLTAVEAQNGIYIKRPLFGIRPHGSWGVADEQADDSWYLDFQQRKPVQQRYLESDRGWGSYKFSGVASRSVRGQVTVSEKSWINTLVRWAARNNCTGFPTTEAEIAGLRDLNIVPDTRDVVVDLPDDFLRLEHVKAIKVGGCLRTVPRLVFKFEQLESLDLDAFWIREIPPEVENLRNLRSLKIGARVLQLPESIVKLEGLQFLALPCNNKFQLTDQQRCWIQKLTESGCVVGKSFL